MRYHSTATVVGPPHMPKDIADILVKNIEIAAKDPEYRKYVEEKLYSAFTFFWPPEQAIREMDKQRELVRDIMDKAGLLKEK